MFGSLLLGDFQLISVVLRRFSIEFPLVFIALPLIFDVFPLIESIKTVLLSAFSMQNCSNPIYCRHFQFRIFAQNNCTVGIFSSETFKAVVLSAFSV